MELRIASLIASSTEILCALGLEDRLVARSHECDYPPTVESLPVVTAPKVDPRRTSAEIDRDVKALLAGALGVYRVDVERLESLRPTHIVTQTQCEVCAVSLADVEKALGSWKGAQGTAPQVISLQPNSLADIFADIARVAVALEVPARGERLAATLRARMEAIRTRAAGLSRRPGTVIIEWTEPLMAAGNWMPELVEMAGGRCLFGEAGKHSPWMRPEDLAARDPEVVVVAPCGFDIERTRVEMPPLAARPEWTGLRAVREGNVFLADGNQYFNRPGPRVAESLEILAEVIHPRAFRFGHEGRGWVRWMGVAEED